MNDYSKRARFYQYEFNTTEDFPVLQYLVSKTKGTIAEIPCGTGRLIQLHESHNCSVLMIDREKKMIQECKRKLKNKKLLKRILPIIGDFKSWRSEIPIQLVIIPRGGIQLLQNINEIKLAFLNLKKSVAINGLIYIDIACPWHRNSKNFELLPEFLRFGKRKKYNGKAIFKLNDNGELIRTFESKIEEKYILVKFLFQAKFRNKKTIDYSSVYRWSRIELNDLLDLLSTSGFKIIEKFGDYNFKNYVKDSARLICIAKKLN